MAGKGAEAGDVFPGRQTEKESEGAAEVGEINIAKLKGDTFDGVAFDEEVSGDVHACTPEEFPGGKLEVLLAKAFELAKGDTEVPGHRAHIVPAVVGQLVPEVF